MAKTNADQNPLYLNVPIPPEFWEGLQARLETTLLEADRVAREKQEFPEYMNAKTTASYLSISFGTLQLLERMGLKSIKVNSKKLFRKTSVDEFMAGLEQEK